MRNWLGVNGVRECTDAAAICKTAADLYRIGWMPGTAGNLSVRTEPDDDEFAITASGRPKGELCVSDVVAARICDGSAVDPVQRPSAEAAIHAAIYRTTDAGAVIHVHSPFGTAIGCRQHHAGVAGIDLARYELVKGLGSAATTGLPARLPIFPNWAEVERIGDEVAGYLAERTESVLPALLIAFHGVTVWGSDLTQARNRLECVEAIAHLLLLTDDKTNEVARW